MPQAPEGSPAAKAGLRATYRDKAGNLVLGDIITSIDGQPVRAVDDLFRLLDSRKVGDRVALGLQRGEQRVTVQVELGDRAQVAPQQQPAAGRR